MASTYAELYSDFQDTVKLYVEKLDATEVLFMRLLTRGVQIFQRETEYIEKNLRISQDANGDYNVPADMMRYIELRLIPKATTNADLKTVLNNNTSTLVQLFSPTQFFEIRNGKVDGWRKVHYQHMVHRDPDKAVILGTIFDNKFLLYPESTTDDLFIRYIPDIPSFSRSGDWMLADDLTAAPPVYNSWFPFDDQLPNVGPGGRTLTRFSYQFTTKTLHPSIVAYEQTFVEFALAQFIRSKGNANFRTFLDNFNLDIEKAKINKPTLFQEGDPYYMFAPFS